MILDSIGQLGRCEGSTTRAQQKAVARDPSDLEGFRCLVLNILDQSLFPFEDNR